VSATAAIQDAFALGEFERGLQLWERYAETLQAAIAAGSASPAMLQETAQMIEACRIAVKVFRGRAMDLLAKADIANRYTNASPGGARLIHRVL
jgi:hypothetical protein